MITDWMSLVQTPLKPDKHRLESDAVMLNLTVLARKKYLSSLISVMLLQLLFYNSNNPPETHTGECNAVQTDQSVRSCQELIDQIISCINPDQQQTH